MQNKILFTLLLSASMLYAGAQTTGKEVLEKAIAATGTPEALNAIKDLQLVGKVTMMGQELDFIQKHILPAGFSTEVNMGGMTAMKQIKNGDNYSVQMQGADQEIDDAGKAELDIKAAYFEEKYMLAKADFQFNLQASEEIDGKKANVVEIVKPDGSAVKAYYDAETGLKLQDSREADGGPMGKLTIVTKYLEYKDYNGVKIPVKLQANFGPIDQDIFFTEVKINSGLKAEEL